MILLIDWKEIYMLYNETKTGEIGSQQLSEPLKNINKRNAR